MIEAVIFDWAGTTVDHGSLAPVRAITELFARRGVAVSAAAVRRGMGLAKRDHIAGVAAAHGLGGAAMVEELYADFQPLQMEYLAAHAGVIAGVAEVVARLRGQGVRIGGTTGYTRPMLEALTAAAGPQGFAPERSLCPEDAGGGRPAPWMLLRLALEFRICATAAAVKVGDTAADMAEGRNAGMWTIGVAATGNEVGLSAEGLAALAAEEREKRVHAARVRLMEAGAHYAVASVAECEAVFALIGERLRAGGRP